MKKIFLWFPLIAIILLCIAAYYFHLETYLNLEQLQKHHQEITDWTSKHYVTAVFIFLVFYFIAVLSSTPIPVFLNIVGGFLFGLLLGTMYVLIASTLGALCVFLAVNTTLGQWLKERATPWISKMRKGIHKNAFTYLLVLRVTPLFPVWLVNIAPAMLNVPLRTFFFSTVIGSIPGSFFYSAIGKGITNIIGRKGTIHYIDILTPPIWIAIIFLTALSFLPLIYNKLKAKKHR